jgi:hypothetical protein
MTHQLELRETLHCSKKTAAWIWNLNETILFAFPKEDTQYRHLYKWTRNSKVLSAATAFLQGHRLYSVAKLVEHKAKFRSADTRHVRKIRETHDTKCNTALCDLGFWRRRSICWCWSCGFWDGVDSEVHNVSEEYIASIFRAEPTPTPCILRTRYTN